MASARATTTSNNSSEGTVPQHDDLLHTTHAGGGTSSTTPLQQAADRDQPTPSNSAARMTKRRVPGGMSMWLVVTPLLLGLIVALPWELNSGHVTFGFTPADNGTLPSSDEIAANNGTEALDCGQYIRATYWFPCSGLNCGAWLFWPSGRQQLIDQGGADDFEHGASGSAAAEVDGVHATSTGTGTSDDTISTSSSSSSNNRCRLVHGFPEAASTSSMKSPPPPVIIMAHGLGAQRDHKLPLFAEYFTRAGKSCMLTHNPTSACMMPVRDVMMLCKWMVMC